MTQLNLFDSPPTPKTKKVAPKPKPPDDTPRLAFADRLDELGKYERHAALIRWQLGRDAAKQFAVTGGELFKWFGHPFPDPEPASHRLRRGKPFVFEWQSGTNFLTRRAITITRGFPSEVRGGAHANGLVTDWPLRRWPVVVYLPGNLLLEQEAGSCRWLEGALPAGLHERLPRVTFSSTAEAADVTGRLWAALIRGALLGKTLDEVAPIRRWPVDALAPERRNT